MYELLIQTAPDKWERLDFGNDLPYLDITAMEIADIGSRTTNKSYDLRLPLTNNNIRILGFPNLFDMTNSRYQYKQLNCRLYADDVELSGKGSVFYLHGITGNVLNCQIHYGLLDIFETLKNAPMTTRDMLDRLGCYSLDKETIAGNTASTCEFALASWLKGDNDWTDKKPTDNHKLSDVYIMECTPFIKVSKIIEAIMNSNGYTVETNLDSYDDFPKTYLSLCSRKPYVGTGDDSYFNSYEPFNCGAISVLTQTETPMLSLSTDPNNNGHGILTDLGGIGGVVHYKAKANCKVKIHFYANCLEGKFATFSYAINQDVPTDHPSVHKVETYYDDVDVPPLVEGDILSIMCNEFSTDSGINSFGLNIEVTELTGEAIVPEYGKVYIANNLGFETQLDAIRSIFQMFAIIPLVDNKTRHVRFDTHKKIMDNCDSRNYVDWSDKLDMSSLNINFTMPKFAQKNYIKLKENADKYVDQGAILIDNQNLPAEATLFSIDKVESGKDFLKQDGSDKKSYNLAQIPYVDKSDNSYNFVGGLTHLVKLDGLKMPVKVYRNIEDTDPVDGEFLQVNHVTVNHLTDGYYKVLSENILRDVRIAEVYLLLNNNDIATFDQLKPVYIEYFGCFFYVNKIDQYQSGKPTRVGLCRINRMK